MGFVDVEMGRSIPSRVDPFAPRKGETLVWRNVNMTVDDATTAKTKTNKTILKDVWGEIPAGDTTAVMGPSGAGKSSLLNILAGRTYTAGKVTVEADIRLNNYRVNPTDKEVRANRAFLAQDDSLQVTSTPREAIRFSAKLRLPKTTSEAELDVLVERMIQELGLASCADTMIGGTLIKGISGGERKRTSVGVELVTKPCMVFLDEPTSGLDSFSAVQLCQLLKKVAKAGASVMFTIHQPSSQIFSSFDRLILLNHGRVMYHGDVADVPDYFGARGQPNPPNYNPADWALDVSQALSMERLEKDGFFPKDTREIGEPFTPGEGQNVLGITLVETQTYQTSSKGNEKAAKTGAGQHGIKTQIQMLFTREVTHVIRDVNMMAARLGITTFLSLLVGSLFFDVGSSNSDLQVNINSHFGALVMVGLMSMFGTAQPVLLAFPEERPVFLREYSTNHYSVISYFVARLSMEAFTTAVQITVQLIITYFMIDLNGSFAMMFVVIYSLAMGSTALAVMLGCSVDDPKVAQELVPLFFVPQMLFAGFFVAPDLIPKFLSWARYPFPLTYAVRILLVEEFGDCQSENCKDLLQNIGANPDETWWNWLVVLGLFLLFRMSALIILQQKANKFYA